MSQLNLNTVRYYDISDIYEYTVDNRPLYDIQSNVDILNNSLSNLGYYQNMTANPETEPAGGFQAMTVAYVGSNGLLSPIDITISPLVFDYTSYPIYLVLNSKGNSQYDCISFSATLKLPTFYNKFLPQSIGHSLKIGPGGTLVDEIYFNLYYSGLNYQNITVGKVLTATSISFGGNQVNINSDNSFIMKNQNDTTTGTLTFYIDNSSTTIGTQKVLLNNISTPYPFIENRAYLSTGSIVDNPMPVPIYFSYTGLISDPLTGTFNKSSVSSSLNELHFGSPTVISGATYDPIYSTAGVNVGSLTDYAAGYLVHNSALTYLIGETNQTLGCNLSIDNSINPTASLVFPLIDNSSTSGFGVTFTSNGIPSNLFTGISTIDCGVKFGSYDTGNGSFVGSVIDSTVLTTAQTTSLTSSDIASYSYAYGQMLVDLAGGSLLLIDSKSTNSNSGIFVRSDDYIILNANEILVNPSTIGKANSVVDKSYVDKSVAASAVAEVPLAGTTSQLPITGTLFANLTGNSSDSSTILDCTTITQTIIKSNTPIEFLASGTSGAYQTILAASPADSSSTPTLSGGTPNDVITRGWLNSFFTSNGSLSNGLTINGTNQILTGSIVFTTPTLFTSDYQGIILSPSSSAISTIGTTNNVVSLVVGSTSSGSFVADSPTVYANLQVAAPIENTHAATKDYVDQAISSVNSSISQLTGSGLVYASWYRAGLVGNARKIVTNGGTIFPAANKWLSCIYTNIASNSVEFSNNFFTTYFSYDSTNGTLTYLPGNSAIFSISCVGNAIPPVKGPSSSSYLCSTAIAVQRATTTVPTIVTITQNYASLMNYSWERGDGSNDYTQSTSYASSDAVCNAVITLNQNDVLFVLGLVTSASVSIVKIG